MTDPGLQVLPASLPLKQVSGWLAQALPHQSHTRHTLQVSRSMEAADNFQATVEATRSKTKRVVIDQVVTCLETRGSPLLASSVSLLPR